jgi:hypothetical protein
MIWLPAAAWYFHVYVFGFALLERKTKHQRRKSTAVPEQRRGAVEGSM